MRISSSENYVRTKRYDFWILRIILTLIFDIILSILWVCFIVFVSNNSVVVVLIKFFVGLIILPIIHTTVASFFDMDISLTFPKTKDSGSLYLVLTKHFQNLPLPGDRIELSKEKISIKKDLWFYRTTKIYISVTTRNHKNKQTEDKTFISITSSSSANRIEKELNHLLNHTESMESANYIDGDESDSDDDDDDDDVDEEEKGEEV